VANPITPPQELVEQWEAETAHTTKDEIWHVAVQAARWGADQELEACVQWTIDTPAYQMTPGALRAARRPKPPSLKEQAIAELEKVDMLWDTTEFSQDTLHSLDTIRRALEALPDD
jgi:hypothetical protein